MLSNLLLNITRRWPLQEQMQEVLDAMFERTVDSGDYVIRQGDDGDNFYVIDRSVIDFSVQMFRSRERARDDERCSVLSLLLVVTVGYSTSSLPRMENRRHGKLAATKARVVLAS